MSKNSKNQNSAGNLVNTNKSSSENRNDTFDLDPKVNPSNMMSSNNDTNQGTMNKKYNQKKANQEF